MDRPEADSGHDADARNDSILAHDRSSVSMMLMGDDSGRTSVGTRTSIPLDSFARDCHFLTCSAGVPISTCRGFALVASVQLPAGDTSLLGEQRTQW